VKIIELTNVDFSLRHFLLPLMRALRARGHEVVGVCAEGPLLDDVRADGFRIIPAPFARRISPIAHLRAFFALVALFRAERPDLVHAHMPISGFLARLAARWAGVPQVAFTCHGFLFNHAEGGWPQRALSLGMELVGGKATDIFLTVSTEEAGDAKRLRIARHPVAVGNGRDPAVFRPDPAARARLRAALGTTPDKVVVLAASRLVARKGYRELAAAMREVGEAELWVAGDRLDSDRGEDMVAMLRSAGLGERLHLLGYRSDMAAVMSAADIFVLPSYFEGLPMSVIEAMLTGLPVVATAIRGPREQVVPELTGLLVPPRDTVALTVALRRLVEDPALRTAMGEAGRARGLELYGEAKVLARTIAALGV